jgi:hypothetical protein
MIVEGITRFAGGSFELQFIEGCLFAEAYQALLAAVMGASLSRKTGNGELYMN